MYVVRTHMFINIKSTVVYVHCTYTFMTVNMCMYIVQTHLYSSTITLHFSSCPISLATPASLRSAQASLCWPRKLVGTPG